MQWDRTLQTIINHGYVYGVVCAQESKDVGAGVDGYRGVYKQDTLS